MRRTGLHEFQLPGPRIELHAAAQRQGDDLLWILEFQRRRPVGHGAHEGNSIVGHQALAQVCLDEIWHMAPVFGQGFQKESGLGQIVFVGRVGKNLHSQRAGGRFLLHIVFEIEERQLLQAGRDQAIIEGKAAVEIVAQGGMREGMRQDRRQWSGTDVWCLAFGYGLQLFFDFAGYTHIAVGAAKALGIMVPENYDRPFVSTTPSAFWTRWHMSLSFWIRGYVFFPLAPLRREMWWRHLALALSMVVFGLWHKATLLFLIWGCYHGVLLVSQRLLQEVERRFNWQLPKLWTPLSWFVTAALISLGWIFFRANSMPQARQMLAALATPGRYASHYLSSSLYILIAILSAGYAVVLLVSDAIDRATAPTDSSSQHSGMLSVMSRSRWFWLPPSTR